MTQPLPHQQRVIEEKGEIDKRRAELVDFIYRDPTFLGLPAAERVLMHEQLKAVTRCSEVLGSRIALWGPMPC